MEPLDHIGKWGSRRLGNASTIFDQDSDGPVNQFFGFGKTGFWMQIFNSNPFFLISTLHFALKNKLNKFAFKSHCSIEFIKTLKTRILFFNRSIAKLDCLSHLEFRQLINGNHFGYLQMFILLLSKAH